MNFKTIPVLNTPYCPETYSFSSLAKFEAVIGVNVDSTIILRAGDCSNFTVVAVIKDEISAKLIFEVGDEVYKLGEDGELYSLICQTDSGESSSFASSALRNHGNFIWKSCGLRIENFHAVQGTRDGVIVLTVDEFGAYLKLYNFRGKINLSASVQIADSDVVCDGWYLKSFLAEQFSIPFMKHFFCEKVLLGPDILVVSNPCGFVSLFPIIDGGNFTPTRIHFDTGKFIGCYVTPCGSGMVLVYEAKFVFLYFCERSHKLEYFSEYVSTCVVDSFLQDFGGKFRLVWTDSESLFYSNPIAFPNPVFKENFTHLKGIVELFSFKSSIIGVNTNFCFYEIYSDDGISTSSSIPSVLKSISTVGKAIENIRENLSEENLYYEALLCERVDPVQIHKKIHGNSLLLENLSDRTFSKDVWSVFIESSVNGKIMVKIFPLSCDLVPLGSDSLSLDYFSDSGGEELKISLMGFVREKSRVLFCELGDVSLKPHVKISSDLKENLLKIFRK